MAGKIIADQIQHSTAGSLDTSYVVNGSAKHWSHTDQSGTPSGTNFNTSSYTDDAVGQTTITMTSAMANAEHVTVFINDRISNGHVFSAVANYTSSTYRIYSFTGTGGTNVDSPNASSVTHGDLA